jgi:type I restriction enzyme, S subunit
MKTTRLDLPVMASWMESNGRRLDCNPYLSGGFEARVLLEKLPDNQKQALQQLTLGGMQGLINPGRIARRWVNDEEHGIPFLSSTDILQADLSTISLISKKAAKQNPKLLIKKDWILITRSGTIGRMVYSRPDMDGMACTEDVLRVIPDRTKILPGYLYAYLSSRFGVSLITSGTYGSIIQHLEPNHIADLPVPRLGEAIEEEIHDLILKAANSRANALKVLHMSSHVMLEAIGLEDLVTTSEKDRPLVSKIQASSLRMRFEGAFHSPLALEAENKIMGANCEVLPLSSPQVTKRLFKPGIFKRHWVDSEEYGIPFVSGNDIYRINPTPERFVSKTSKDVNSYILNKGWIVFQAAGQLNGLFGSPLLINSHLDGYFCSDDVFRIVPHSEIDAGYIYAFLRTNYGQRLLKRQSYGYSIPRIVDEHVAQILIPWATERIRQEIGQKVIDAWEDLANAIQIENEAVRLIENAMTTT